jgi:hypothetical protein
LPESTGHVAAGAAAVVGAKDVDAAKDEDEE